MENRPLALWVSEAGLEARAHSAELAATHPDDHVPVPLSCILAPQAYMENADVSSALLLWRSRWSVFPNPYFHTQKSLVNVFKIK